MRRLIIAVACLACVQTGWAGIVYSTFDNPATLSFASFGHDYIQGPNNGHNGTFESIVAAEFTVASATTITRIDAVLESQLDGSSLEGGIYTDSSGPGALLGSLFSLPITFHTDVLTTVSGLSIPVTPGNYWFQIAPATATDWGGWTVGQNPASNAVNQYIYNGGKLSTVLNDKNFAPYFDIQDSSASAAPEPASFALAALALALVVLARRRVRPEVLYGEAHVSRITMRALTIAAVCLAWVQAGTASILYSTFDDPATMSFTQFGVDSVQGPNTNGANADIFAAAAFNVASDTTISRVDAVLEGQLDGSVLEGGIYSDDGGVPGTLIGSAFDLSLTLDQVLVTTVTGLDIPVTAGDYWLEISPGSDDSFGYWIVGSNFAPTQGWSFVSIGGQIVSRSNLSRSQYFDIQSSSTPEPASFGLAASAFVLAALAVRRVRR